MNEITRRGLIFGAATAGAYGLLVGVERFAFRLSPKTAGRRRSGPVKNREFADDGAKLGIYTLGKCGITIRMEEAASRRCNTT